MKKIILISILIIFFINMFSISNQLLERLEKYSGTNKEEFTKILSDEDEQIREYANFILSNCTPNDLSALDIDYLRNNIEYAIKTRDLKYSNQYSDKIFKHFVLPHRVSQEPLENWRKLFYDQLLPIVKDVENIEEAFTLVNLWVAEQMSFKQTSGRDQAPITTIRRGFGRCEESMIIVIAAARSVGIPCRPASVPYWNFTDSNHAWVEVWTPDGWKYSGEPENSLNRAWFSNTTKRASIITSRAFGNFDSPDVLKMENNSTKINSIKYYSDFDYCTINVVDENNVPQDSVNIYIYATSFGGLFNMAELTTDNEGKTALPLGKSSIYLTAYKDNKIAYSVFNTLKNNEITLTLKDKKIIEDDFDMLFQIPKNSQKSEDIGLVDNFYLKRDLRNNKRKVRLLSQKNGIKFTDYFDKTYNCKAKDFFINRKKFLEKCDELAGASSDYLYLYDKYELPEQKILTHIINEWGIKELCELPDTTKINDVVEIFSENWDIKTVPDSIFINEVIATTFRGIPQNGWQKEFYETISKFRNKSNKKMLKKIKKYVDENTIADDQNKWTYFSGSLNPLEILNMKNMNEYYQDLLVLVSLNQLGVPLQYDGIWKYEYKGKYMPIFTEKENDEEEENELVDFSLSVFLDGEKIKAEPWKNFLIASLSNGLMSYTYFDGKNDSLDFVGQTRIKSGEELLVQSYIRNSNGDADVKILPFNKKIEIHLETPKEYVDKTNNLPDEIIALYQNKKNDFSSENHKLIFVGGKVNSEPEVRMSSQIIEKLGKFNDKNIQLINFSQRKDDSPFSGVNEWIVKSCELVNNQLEYPIIILLDNENNVIFSSAGYTMGLTELILRKVK